MLDELKKQSHEEEKTILKTQILDKFFTSSRPLLTSRMIDFILEPGKPYSLSFALIHFHAGSIENTIAYVTRVNPNNNIVNNPLKQRIIGILGKDDEVLRKSFNVVDLFVNPSNDLDLILSEKLHIICKDNYLGKCLEFDNFFCSEYSISNIPTRFKWKLLPFCEDFGTVIDSSPCGNHQVILFLHRFL
jgi:hypothetical protein